MLGMSAPTIKQESFLGPYASCENFVCVVCFIRRLLHETVRLSRDTGTRTELGPQDQYREVITHYVNHKLHL